MSLRRCRTALVLLFALAGPGAAVAPAHDIPNERVDRSTQLVIEPGRLRIDYEVSLSELTLAQDLRSLIGSLPDADRTTLFERYGSETGPLNARGFLITVDGAEQDVQFERVDVVVEEHPRFTFHLLIPLPPSGRLTVQDTNYTSSQGTSRLAARAGAGAEIAGYEGPIDVEQTPPVPVWQLSDAEERATRQAAFEFRSEGSESRAVTPVETRPPPDQTTTGTMRTAGGLTDLLDRGGPGTWLGLVLVAFGLGAAHAIQPGHGKTLIAAATLGAHGGRWRGALLGLVTAGVHFGSVVAIAAVVALFPGRDHAALHTHLARSAGLLIAGIGLWRLGRHLAGHGEHPAGEAHITHPTPTRSLLGLGLAGGLVPCWDAVVLVLLADLAGRLRLGLGLLVAFSLGMAAVLVAIGLLAGGAHSALVASGRSDRWSRPLGIAGGLALTAIGLYLWGAA